MAGVHRRTGDERQNGRPHYQKRTRSAHARGRPNYKLGAVTSPPRGNSNAYTMEVDDIVLALRPMQSELSVLQRADGSARVQHGGTSVLCAVYGPADVKASKERCDK